MNEIKFADGKIDKNFRQMKKRALYKTLLHVNVHVRLVSSVVYIRLIHTYTLNSNLLIDPKDYKDFPILLEVFQLPGSVVVLSKISEGYL